MVKLLIGAVVAAVIIVVSFSFIMPLTQQNTAGTTTTDTTNTTSFNVTIEGEVVKTGTYALQEGVTMADLISAAGGVNTNADERTYYDAFVLTSGMTYYVGPLHDAADVCSSKEITKVNVNSDDATALATVSAITSNIADSIVSYRSSNGEFKSLEQLLDVYGIGNATYRKIRNYVYLHE